MIKNCKQIKTAQIVNENTLSELLFLHGKHTIF